MKYTHCNPPFFSICIPAYKDFTALSRALDSLLKQKYKNFECIIRDDSQDNSIASVVEARPDSRIRYFSNTPALGVPANWNAAITAARGQWITLLHQDDYYKNSQVLSDIAMLTNNADIIVCGRSIIRGDIFIGNYIDAHDHVNNFLHDYPHRSLVVNRLGHPSTVFFKSQMKSILFDNNNTYFLDTEWYARLWRQAQSIQYIPRPLVVMELGRQGQISGQCVQHLDNILYELQRILQTEKATTHQKSLAVARLVVSHLRHWRSANLSALKKIWNDLPFKGKATMVAASAVFTTHMLYRLLRKQLGLRPWG